MEKLEELKKLVKACNDDIELYSFINKQEQKTCIMLTIEDFAGFDDDWNETDRELSHLKEINRMIEWLEAESDKIVRNYTNKYYFDGFYVWLTHSESDI